MAESIDIGQLRAQLLSIYDDAIELESHYAEELAAVQPDYRDGALNLVHYLALRETDIRDLQEILTQLGLSSLDRVERDVLTSIRAVLAALAAMSPEAGDDTRRELSALEATCPQNDANRRAIFGDSPADRDAAIMVTLPTEAASSTSLVSEMIAAGMNVARINCARDSEEIWAGMIENIRNAADEAGSVCKIVMDLAGPRFAPAICSPARVFFTSNRAVIRWDERLHLDVSA